MGDGSPDPQSTPQDSSEAPVTRFARLPESLQTATRGHPRGGGGKSRARSRSPERDSRLTLPSPASETGGPNHRGPALEVVIDFDGTLVEPNVAILLVEEFAEDGEAVAHEIDRRLHEGTITLRDAWRRQAALLPADRLPEMRAFVRARVPLRSGARGLLELLGRYRVPVTIVSGGLEFYIREVLDRERLELPVRSDRLHVLPNGRVEVTHPFEHPTCRLCGICKAQLTGSSDNGVRTVFIADGSTDRYGAETAEIVFARGRLLDYCRTHGIPHWPFADDFEPVTRRMAQWLNGGRELPRPRPRGLAGSACPISAELLRRVAPSEVR